MNEQDSDLLVQYESRDVYQPIPAGTTDLQFIEMWLYKRPETTQEVYRKNAYRFLFFLEQDAEETQKRQNGNLLRQATLPDLQDFADTLEYLKPASKVLILKSIKSLFTFAEKTGYHTFNVGAAVRLPKVQRRLALRILSEEQVLRILAQTEKNVRNHALLRLLYVSGARVSEVCSVTWRDLLPRDFGMGQITLMGKGEKERAVLLPEYMYQELLNLREWESRQKKRSIGVDEPIFMPSHGGGKYKDKKNENKEGNKLDPSRVHRIVEAAAILANVQTYEGEQRRTNLKTHKIESKPVLKSRVSPHFFRHSHASHALDRGVPPHVVMETLGHSSLDVLTAYSHARPTDSSALKLPR